MAEVKTKKIAVNLTEEENARLMSVLTEKKQSKREFLIVQINSFLENNCKKIIPTRKRGVVRACRIEFRISDGLYDKIEERAKKDNCKLGTVVREAILYGLKKVK